MEDESREKGNNKRECMQINHNSQKYFFAFIQQSINIDPTDELLLITKSVLISLEQTDQSRL